MIGIIIRYLLFIFDILSVIYSYQEIIIDNIFIDYCITIFTFFIYIKNKIKKYIYWIQNIFQLF
jgi:hypothetical protein